MNIEITRIVLIILTATCLVHSHPSEVPSFKQKSSEFSSAATTSESMSVTTMSMTENTINTKLIELTTDMDMTSPSYSSIMSSDKSEKTTIDTKISEHGTMVNSESSLMTSSMSMTDRTADMTSSMAHYTSPEMPSSMTHPISMDVPKSTISEKSMVTVSSDVDVLDSTKNVKREQLNEAVSTLPTEPLEENSMMTEKQDMEKTQTEPPITTEKITMKMAEMTTIMTTVKPVTTITAMTTEKMSKAGTPKPLTATMTPTERTTMKNEGNVKNVSDLLTFVVTFVFAAIVF